MLKTNKIIEELKRIMSIDSIEGLYSQYQYDLNVLDFINKGTRILKWTNLPNGIDGRILNLQLFGRGRLVAFKHDTLGNFILPMVRVGGVNANGYMTHIKPVAVGEQSNELNNLTLEEGKDCVVFRMNDLEVPPILYAQYYGEKVSNTLDNIDTNTIWTSLPMILKSSGDTNKDKKDALILKEIIGLKGVKLPAITDAFANIEIVPTKTQFYGLELFDMLESYKNLYYEFLGVKHHETKKERLSEAEVQDNSEESNVNANKVFEPLLEKVQEANKLFGWNIKLSLNISNEDSKTNVAVKYIGTRGQ